MLTPNWCPLIDLDHDEFCRSVAEWVADRRRNRGWSQEELAALMTERGLQAHQTTVGKLERGVQVPSLLQMWALLDIFEESITDVLGGQPPVVKVVVETRKPWKYLLVDRETGQQWEIREGRWVRAND